PGATRNIRRSRSAPHFGAGPATLRAPGPPRHRWGATIRRRMRRSLRLLVGAGDVGGDAAARREGARDPAAQRPAGRDEVVEQAVDEGFVEDALVAVALEVELERAQLDAGFAWSVGEGDGAEIGLPGLGAKTRELRADDLDGVIAAGILVRKRF